MAASETLHEPFDRLSAFTRDSHRALTSLQEELEAVDWYRQRAEAAEDGALREILLHNMREEMEHAAMLLEWLRRGDGDLDRALRTYLFTTAPITTIEKAAEGAAPESAQAAAASTPGLTIGALKGG